MSYQIPHSRDQLRRTAAGVISETGNLGMYSATGVIVSQTVYYGLVGLLKGDVITNINVSVQAVSSGASTNLFVGIYNTSGNRLAVSNDLTTSIDTTGTKSLALSSAYTITQDGGYYLALLNVTGNTPATLMRQSSTGASSNAVGTGVRSWSTQTGQSTLPTTATFAQGTFTIWMGCS